jgi:type II secretory pathway pseudopilin PulG
MIPKFTILKVLIRPSNKGFTLLELIISTSILILIMGLALDAFLHTNKTFTESNSRATANQDLASIAEYIGNDIRQIGEGIEDNSFPAVEFIENTDSGSMTGSSKLIVRRLASPVVLNLCEDLAAASTPTPSRLVVADSSLTATNCGVTLSTVSPKFPTNLRSSRNFRCQLDVPNANWQSSTTDACASTAPTGSANPERLLMAVSDRAGHYRTFVTDNETEVSTGTKYGVAIALDDLGHSTLASDTRNLVAYPVGSPIYTLEEHVYSLDDQGNLNLAVNGAPTVLLLPNVAQFGVKGKLFTNITDKAILVPSAADYVCADDPNYVCRFNANTSTEAAVQWKTIGGIQLAIQAKYDATGKGAIPSAADLDKLTVRGQYFPRNAMSSD